jgi:hypothetical protein
MLSLFGGRIILRLMTPIPHLEMLEINHGQAETFGSNYLYSVSSGGTARPCPGIKGMGATG